MPDPSSHCHLSERRDEVSILDDLACAPGDLLFHFAFKTAGSPRREPQSWQAVLCRCGARNDSVNNERLNLEPQRSFTTSQLDRVSGKCSDTESERRSEHRSDAVANRFFLLYSTQVLLEKFVHAV